MPKTGIERAKHLIQIDRWDFRYHFGINEVPQKQATFQTGSYNEYRQIWIEGLVLRPSVKAPYGRVVCHPETSLIGASEKWSPDTEGKRAVGHVEYRGKDYSAHLSFPADMLGPILTMLSSGRYKHITFEAEKGREAFIYSFSFHEQIDADDL